MLQARGSVACLLALLIGGAQASRHSQQLERTSSFGRALATDDATPDSHMTNQDVQVFIHVHCRAQWARILEEQIYALMWSGLWVRASAVRVYINKLDEKQDMGFASSLPDVFGDKVKVTFRVNDTSFERATLQDIRSLITPTTHLLYLHTKGVTKGEGDYAVHYWRLYLEFFLIRHWPTCLCMLASGQYDTVGVDLRSDPNRYSGNFWWSTGQWWLQLKEVVEPSSAAPEMHLLTAVKDPNVKPRSASIADSSAISPNLYQAQLLPSMYAATANWTQADALGCLQHLSPP